MTIRSATPEVTLAPRPPNAPVGGRRLFAQVESSTPTTLAEHRRYFARPAGGGRANPRIATEIDHAGLRGRGGAAFPTAIKMRAVASSKKPSVVVVNGTEGEPVSSKDATLLQLQPHLVLDGAAHAAHAVGADVVYVCIERNKGRTIEALLGALEERNRFEPGSIVMHLQQTPPRYVAGEETALIHWLNGGETRV